MKIEFEVKAFGKENVEGFEDAYKSAELVRMHNLSPETTLAELEAILTKLFEEVEVYNADPEHCLGKITIRAKKIGGQISYLG